MLISAGGEIRNPVFCGVERLIHEIKYILLYIPTAAKKNLSAGTSLQLNPVRILRGGRETYSDVLQGFLVPALLGKVVKTISAAVRTF